MRSGFPLSLLGMTTYPNPPSWTHAWLASVRTPVDSRGMAADQIACRMCGVTLANADLFCTSCGLRQERGSPGDLVPTLALGALAGWSALWATFWGWFFVLSLPEHSDLRDEGIGPSTLGVFCVSSLAIVALFIGWSMRETRKSGRSKWWIPVSVVCGFLAGPVIVGALVAVESI